MSAFGQERTLIIKLFVVMTRKHYLFRPKLLQSALKHHFETILFANKKINDLSLVINNRFWESEKKRSSE